VDEPLHEGGTELRSGGGAAPWWISNLCKLCQKRGQKKTAGGATPAIGADRLKRSPRPPLVEVLVEQLTWGTSNQLGVPPIGGQFHLWTVEIIGRISTHRAKDSGFAGKAI